MGTVETNERARCGRRELCMSLKPHRYVPANEANHPGESIVAVPAAADTNQQVEYHPLDDELIYATTNRPTSCSISSADGALRVNCARRALYIHYKTMDGVKPHITKGFVPFRGGPSDNRPTICVQTAHTPGMNGRHTHTHTHLYIYIYIDR